MDLNAITTMPPVPTGDDVLAEMRDLGEQLALIAPRRMSVVVSKREYDRFVAAGVPPRLLNLCSFVPEGTAVVLDVDRIERACERLQMGPL